MVDDALSAQALDDMGTTGQSAVRISELGGLTGAKIEDLMPLKDIATMMDRVERRPEKMFADSVVAGQPFQEQVLSWAKSQNIVLKTDWRVQLAERMRKWLLEQDDPRVSKKTLTRWLTLMQTLDAA
jgi:hypothetical protein